LTEQMAILRTLLGDGIKRFLERSANTVTSTGAYPTTEETIRAIGDYLKKKQNPWVEYLRFEGITQADGESFDDFYISLCDLARVDELYPY